MVHSHSHQFTSNCARQQSMGHLGQALEICAWEAAAAAAAAAPLCHCLPCTDWCRPDCIPDCAVNYASQGDCQADMQLMSLQGPVDDELRECSSCVMAVLSCMCHMWL